MHTERGVSRRALLRSVGGVTVGAAGVAAGAGTRTVRAHERPATGANHSGESDERTPDPSSYEPVGRLSLPGTKELVVGADGTVGYAAVTDGYATIDLSEPTAPTVLAERRSLLAGREGGPLEQVHDVDHEGDRLLVVGPANPSGGLTAAVLVDVSDPAAPREVAVHETEFPIHNCALVGGRAYLTANGVAGNPLVILDAGAEFEERGRWSLLDHDERWQEVDPGLRTLHDVWVLDDVAYLAYWDAGTWLLDVSDPTAPAYLANVGGTDRKTLAELDRAGAAAESLVPPGNSHYVATDPGGSVLAVGEETWAVESDSGDRTSDAENDSTDGTSGVENRDTDGTTGGPSGIDLYDCTDPTAPRHLASVEPPPSPDATYGGTWTTAHNFELAGDVLYSSWYRGGVRRHDVSDPSEPRELAWWREPADASFWTAQRGVSGEYFVAADMGVDGVYGVADDAGVVVFPDEAGTQSPPPEPALTAAQTPAGTTATAAPESASIDEGPRGDSASDEGVSIARAPGLGVGSALLALGIGTWRRLRKCGSER
jgi:hypothetical protein